MATTSERLPSLARVEAFAQAATDAVAKARLLNTKVTAEDEKQYVVAGFKAVAKRFFKLAICAQSRPEELRIYADILLKYAEQRIKTEKNALIRRNLELLETKVKALQELAQDRKLPDAQYFQKFRRVMDGSNGQEVAQLIEKST